jgi:hypothetical protein
MSVIGVIFIRSSDVEGHSGIPLLVSCAFQIRVLLNASKATELVHRQF